MHQFEAPTVEGEGSDLPALMGLKSISGKKGVIETEPGKERLSFPGPGGYKIEWSPGTRHFPLKSAPSGHLVVPLGDFSRINPSPGGVAEEVTVFHAHPQPENGTSSSSSSGPYPTQNNGE